jgi:hypothetical protein
MAGEVEHRLHSVAGGFRIGGRNSRIAGRFFKNAQEGGYQELEYHTREYRECNTGFEYALLELKKRGIAGALEKLGKPSLAEQYLTIFLDEGVARVKYDHPLATNFSLAAFNPHGVIVCNWEEEDVWYVATALYDGDGDLYGYNYKLYYKDASVVQRALEGMFVEVTLHHYQIQEKIAADHELETYTEWCMDGGPSDFLIRQLKHERGPSRANLILGGASNAGKSSFIRSWFAEEGRDFVILRMPPDQFRNFRYPTWLKKLAIILDDVDGVIPPRGISDSRGVTEDFLRNLEFSPANESSNAGVLEKLAVIMTANSFEHIDHAAIQNTGRIDRRFLLTPGSWARAQGEIVFVDGSGVSTTIPLSEAMVTLKSSIPEGAR